MYESVVIYIIDTTKDERYYIITSFRNTTIRKKLTANTIIKLFGLVQGKNAVGYSNQENTVFVHQLQKRSNIFFSNGDFDTGKMVLLYENVISIFTDEA